MTVATSDAAKAGLIGFTVLSFFFLLSVSDWQFGHSKRLHAPIEALSQITSVTFPSLYLKTLGLYWTTKLVIQDR